METETPSVACGRPIENIRKRQLLRNAGSKMIGPERRTGADEWWQTNGLVGLSPPGISIESNGAQQDLRVLLIHLAGAVVTKDRAANQWRQQENKSMNGTQETD